MKCLQSKCSGDSSYDHVMEGRQVSSLTLSGCPLGTQGAFQVTLAELWSLVVWMIQLYLACPTAALLLEVRDPVQLKVLT